MVAPWFTQVAIDRFLSLCGNGRIRQTVLGDNGEVLTTRFTDSFLIQTKIRSRKKPRG